MERPAELLRDTELGYESWLEVDDLAALSIPSSRLDKSDRPGLRGTRFWSCLDMVGWWACRAPAVQYLSDSPR